MVQLLTIVSHDWSIKKTVKFFNVTEHSAYKLRKEQDILAVPEGFFFYYHETHYNTSHLNMKS